MGNQSENSMSNSGDSEKTDDGPGEKSPDVSGEKSPDVLLGDLESIKELLDEEQLADAEATAPLLDDVVDGGIHLEETSFVRPAPEISSAADSDTGNVGDELFEALLGDDWKDAASDMLTTARGAIEAHRNQWTPEHTDDLNEALRIRIDATLSQWLENTVRAHMKELHAELLSAAETVLSEQISALLKTQSSFEESDSQDSGDNNG
jgi:hypothetical protein